MGLGGGLNGQFSGGYPRCYKVEFRRKERGAAIDHLGGPFWAMAHPWPDTNVVTFTFENHVGDL